jgi:predicted nucleic acid-binding protein
VLLSSVAAYELYLGATTVHDKRDLDRIRAAFIEARLVATPIFEDWCEAAILLSRYSRSHGVPDPRLHLADVLIVLCASRIRARVMSWNVKDMRRWNRLLPPRRRIRIEEPDHRG